MNQTIIILLLILLIIIALNYKNISYDKIYKKVLKIIRDYISEKMDKKKRRHKKKKESSKNKSNQDDFNQDYDDDDDLNKIIEESNKMNDDSFDTNSNGSFLSDISTVELNTIDSGNSVGTSLSFS